jgi:hypothetical protein
MLVALSCGSDESPTKPLPPPSELDQAVRLWQSHALQDYDVDEVRHCYCPPPRDWTAQVRAGVIQGQGWTVEEMFDRIRDAQDGAFRLEATYDAVYGYPTRVYVDWNEWMADEESLSLMSNLQPAMQ